MVSDVFFIDFRANVQNNFTTQLIHLLEQAGLPGTIKPRDRVAIKIHFITDVSPAYNRVVL